MADIPSRPSPEILEKLRQLKEEAEKRIAQQDPKDANTLAWQQSNAFKRIYPKASGGQIDMDRMRLELMGKAKSKQMHMAEGGSDDEYRGEHTAPGPHYGAPLHDVSSGGMYPADFYGNNGRRYYANEGWDFDNDAYNKVTRVKNKPNAMVSIHRAVPTSVYKEALKKEAPLKHMIRKGDWVAINKEYARAHGESVLNGDYKIASMRVPAKHVWTNADSIHEWGYHPEEEKKANGGITHAHHLDIEERPI